MIDVNGTNYHLLMGESDWQFATDNKFLEWSSQQNSMRLKEVPYRFPILPADLKLNLRNRRGAAADRYGNWYWVDETLEQILFRAADGSTHKVETFWPIFDSEKNQKPAGEFKSCVLPPSPAPLQFGGLAVTKLHYLIVGVISKPALLIFN